MASNHTPEFLEGRVGSGAVACFMESAVSSAWQVVSSVHHRDNVTWWARV